MTINRTTQPEPPPERLLSVEGAADLWGCVGLALLIVAFAFGWWLHG